MSSARTAPTSTTPSSTSWPSLSDGARTAIIACGALAGHVREIAARRGWPVEVHALPAPLHNRPARIAPLLAAEPGTYLLTDFLVRSFDKTVLAGLGLDRHPELWPDYFGHYRRLVWLGQARDA